ncbi:MAG: hypothetical protein Kow0031_26520 [Anaerolineae bacterium]
MAQRKDNNNFFIVGIGTSAGGLEALEKFFSNVPVDSNMAYVVIQHLSPDYKSHMVELLSKYTPLAVHEVRDGMTVKPNNIYLIPRRKNMTIFKGQLYLVDYDRSHGLNLPIDIFFESLAEDQGEKAVGIVLSGTGSDGTRGIRAIKEKGGMVLAQDESARFDGMPRSAISTRLVDYIAAPEEMPINLLNYIKHPCLANDPVSQPQIAEDEVTLGKLFAILRNHTEIDFSDYKPNTILRRIGRRMSINQIDELADYVDYLQHSPGECQTLFKEFLIGVTRFFRDPEAFNVIKQQVLPQLISGRKRHDQIRIWAPGCSTGEEAYSLAILFHEYMEQSGNFVDVKIFATDIDRKALDYASHGIYPESVTADISSERLQNYFVKKGDTYQVLRHIRGSVVFAYQNLIKDPPFSKMDLISCRNLLIYLQPVLQKKVLDVFQFALKPGGYLFLGNSETIGNSLSSFSIFSNRWKIFQYEGNSSLPIHPHTAPTVTDKTPVAVQDYRMPRTVDDWRGADSVLRGVVEHLMPPCVVIDDNYMVIHAFGEVQPFLQAPTGYRVSLNVLNMVRDELSLPLSTALHRTAQEQQPVYYRNIKLVDDAVVKHINLTTQPFWERNHRQLLILVSFELVESTPAADDDSEDFNLKKTVNLRIENLEQELQYTRENLQATIEELETSNEELQATNEELLAANEELQSTNEELQSVNEELTTVNTEYQLKIRELTNLNNDINNLFSSTNIATVFLDANLCVRKFTAAAQRDFNLLDQDIGRPIKHISHNLVDLDIVRLAEQVMETVTPQEQEVQNNNGEWFIIAVHPYVTHANLVDGVIVTQVEITRRKATEETLRERESQLRSMFKDAVVGISRLSLEGTFVECNPSFQAMVGYSQGELQKLSYTDLTHPDDLPTSQQAFNDLVSGKSHFFKQQKRLVHKDETPVWVTVTGSLVTDDNHKPLLVMEMVENNSYERTARDKLHMFESAVSASGEAVVITAPNLPDNPIVYINPAFEQLTGYKANQVIGHNCRFLQQQDRDQPALDKLRKAIKNGERCEVVLRNYRKDGTLFYNHLTIFPVHNEDGDLVYFVGIQQHIPPPDGATRNRNQSPKK